MINLTAQEKNDFTIIEIEIEGGVCTPDDLKKLTFPQVNLQKGVIISGRAPVWVFATIVHEFHPSAWVATFDPRLGGGVVVQTHSQGIKVGDVITIN